jgi:hypothetical protein
MGSPQLEALTEAMVPASLGRKINPVFYGVVLAAI